MATLEKIRKRGPLVALVVGFALVAFILGDLFRSGSTLFRGSQYDVATVDGKSITIQEYEAKVKEIEEIVKLRSGGVIDNNTEEQLRAQTWESLIREQVMGKEYEKTGVDVCNEEVYDMMTGKNPDPTIVQLFTNPETGEFNPQQVTMYLKSIEKEDDNNPNKKFMVYLQYEFKNKQIFKKYTNLVAKGLYVTSREAKLEADGKNKTVSFRFVSLPYSSIADNTVKVTDAEVKEYYEKFKKRFKQEPSRDIEYVTFDAVASPEDLAEINKAVEQSKADLASQPDSTLETYLRTVEGGNYDPKRYKQGELAASIDAFAFNANPGEILGPYTENGAMKLTKLVAVKELPDSVKARHILLQPSANTPDAIAQAKKLADSIKIVLKKGSKFEALAQQFSKDQGSAVKGGDLGWFADGAMVPEFNKACFEGKKGEVKIVTTQFGVHVIEITDQKKPVKKVQIASIERKIEPGKESSDKMYQLAIKFASENMERAKFEASAKKQNLNIKVANNLAPMENYIAGLSDARQVIQWANKTEKSKVSDVFVCGNSNVIAVLTEVREKGFAPVEQVKNVISFELIKEKKAQQLAAKVKNAMKSAGSIDQLASSLTTQVLDATDISYASFNVPAAGFEPALIATATSLPKDKLSEPIEGKNGVFVAVVTAINTPAQLADAKSEKETLARGNRARASYQIYESLKESANVEDNRAKFF
jgi:peptidyl-prolyl cis-trans isomerase D